MPFIPVLTIMAPFLSLSIYLSLPFAWLAFEFRTIINMKFILLKYIKHNK